MGKRVGRRWYTGTEVGAVKSFSDVVKNGRFSESHLASEDGDT